MKKAIYFLTFVITISINLYPDKSPATAMISSIILPGGGQYYTGRTTRGVFFSILQGSLLSSTLYSHYKYKYYSAQFEQTGYYNDSVRARGFYDLRNNLLWWDAIVIAVSVADAYVGAKMYGFYEETESGDNRINIGCIINW